MCAGRFPMNWIYSKHKCSSSQDRRMLTRDWLIFIRWPISIAIRAPWETYSIPATTCLLFEWRRQSALNGQQIHCPIYGKVIKFSSVRTIIEFTIFLRLFSARSFVIFFSFAFLVASPVGHSVICISNHRKTHPNKKLQFIVHCKGHWVFGCKNTHSHL